jgi:hypothetical protein
MVSQAETPERRLCPLRPFSLAMGLGEDDSHFRLSVFSFVFGHLLDIAML